MAVGLKHPAVKTFIGDGFAFLRDRKAEFDVIITDSSDPEGPAESLFQKPYFQLLHDALKPGGVVTTQGCMPFPFARPRAKPSGWKALVADVIDLPAENQWLHLPLIADLKKMCSTIFPRVEYAYTTIPTYPSGQIGFLVCCKDPNRDVKKPSRWWKEDEEEKLCRYYSKQMHEAAFVLPTFARRMLR